MILAGKPVTVQEFTDMDRVSGWNLGNLMQGQSPTLLLLCGWIKERREQRNLTWEEYQKRELPDFEILAKEIDLQEADPTNGNERERTPVSVTSGESLPLNSENSQLPNMTNS